MDQEIIRIDLNGVNCYLAKAGDGFILFDTGGHMIMDKVFNNRCIDLEEELEKAGCRPGNLKLIVLTHGDNDHTANAAYIRDKYKAKIAMHSADLELVDNPDIEKVMQTFKYKSIAYKIIFCFLKHLIKKISIKTLEDFERFKPDIFIKEEDNLDEYGLEAKVLHIPGHTAGSIGILTADRDLISGDLFINTDKPNTAPNALDFKELAESVRRLRELKIKTVYPGHGNPFKADELW